MATIYNEFGSYPFTSGETGTGGSWTNISSIKAAAGYAYVTLSGGTPTSKYLYGKWRKSTLGDLIPVDAIPYGVTTRLSAMYAGIYGPPVSCYMKIDGGTSYAITLTSAQATYEKAYSTYFMQGLTDAEWWELANGTRSMRMIATDTVLNVIRCYWMSVRLYYTLPEDSGIILCAGSIT